jgi:hypothetical protein
VTKSSEVSSAQSLHRLSMGEQAMKRERRAQSPKAIDFAAGAGCVYDGIYILYYIILYTSYYIYICIIYMYNIYIYIHL